MKVGVILGGIVFAIVGGLAVAYQLQGDNLVRTGRALADSTKALFDARSTIRNQASIIGTLRIENATLGQENATLKQQKAEATTSAVIAGSKLAESNARLQVTASQLSAIRAKQEADRPIGGVGAIETTELDSVLNRKVASLKAQISNLESVAKELQESIATLQSEKSELERELNGPDGSRAKLAEKIQQLADVRTLVQTKRAEAKGLFSGKRRRVLGEVDAKLGQVQR